MASMSPETGHLEIKKSLVTGKSYHGQIFAESYLPGVSPTFRDLDTLAAAGVDIFALREILSFFGLPGLYSHQGRALERLWRGRDVLLATDEGSGKSTLCDIAVLLALVSRRGHCLYVCADDQDANQRKQILDGHIRRANWEWGISAEACLEGTGDIEEKLPDVIVTTAAWVEKHILRRRSPALEGVLSHLEMIVIEDVFEFPAEVMTHLTWVIRSLNFLLATPEYSPRLLVTSRAMDSPASFLPALGREGIEVVDDDGSPKSAAKLTHWVPTLEAAAGPGGISTRRADYASEVVWLASSLLGRGLARKLLIWHTFAPLSETELRKIRRRTIEELNRQGRTAGDEDFQVVSSLNRLSRDLFRNFDAVIATGYPGDFVRFIPTLRNLVREEGELFVVSHEDPVSQYLLEGINFAGEELPGGLLRSLPLESGSVAEYYGAKMLLGLSTPRFDRDRYLAAGGESGREMLDYLSDHGFVRRLDGKVMEIVNRNALEAIPLLARFEGRMPEQTGGLPVGVVDRHPVVIYTSEGVLTHSDRECVPYQFYPGGVLYFGNDKYVVRGNLGGREGIEVMRAGEDAPVFTSPILDVSIEETAGVAERVRRTRFGDLRLFSARIGVRTRGYHRYASYSLSGHSPEDKQLYGDNDCPAVETDGLLALRWRPGAGEGEIHGLSHFARFFLRSYIKDAFSLINVIPEGDAILFHSISPARNNALLFLWDNIEEVARRIVRLAYLVLINCPCDRGCPLCLKTIDCCAEVQNPEMDKHGLLDFAGQALDEQRKVEFFKTFKREGLDKDEALEAYKEIRDRILLLFKIKFDLGIQSRADLRVMPARESEECGCVGVYSSGDNIVRVVEKLTQRLAYEIISHEYAHNWERDPGNPAGNVFSGFSDEKLLIEGFAQWVAFRTMDFFGQVDNMSGIKLREWDEYGEGFRLLHYLEQNIAGFFGVVEFIKNGRVADPESGKEYSLWDLLRESGVEERLKDSNPDLLPKTCAGGAD